MTSPETMKCEVAENAGDDGGSSALQAPPPPPPTFDQVWIINVFLPSGAMTAVSMSPGSSVLELKSAARLDLLGKLFFELVTADAWRKKQSPFKTWFCLQLQRLLSLVPLLSTSILHLVRSLNPYQTLNIHLQFRGPATTVECHRQSSRRWTPKW